MGRKNRNKNESETEVSEVSIPEDVQPEAELAEDATTEPKANDQNKPKKEKAPVPEGFVTPVAFAKLLTERVGSDVRPQIIYGYIRNSKTFLENVAKQNTDGAWIVNT